MDNYGAGGAAGVNRRGFLKLAGMGGAAVAAVGGMRLAGSSALAGRAARAKVAPTESATLQFRAMGALPKAPLPSYATHVVEGTVDLTTGTGIVTTRVLAGHPGGTSGVGLPGLARIIRIDRVVAERDEYRLAGVIEDRSQLRRGEAAEVEIVVDRKNGVVRAPFAGGQVSLPLA